MSVFTMLSLDGGDGVGSGPDLVDGLARVTRRARQSPTSTLVLVAELALEVL